jgi:hypothetical protein
MLVTETTVFKSTVGIVIKFTLELFLTVWGIQRKLQKRKQSDKEFNEQESLLRNQ